MQSFTAGRTRSLKNSCQLTPKRLIMKRPILHIIGLISAVLMAGCSTPQIDTKKFTKPKTVVIDDFPDVLTVAVIAPINISQPSRYFSSAHDDFFLIGGAKPAQAGGVNQPYKVNQLAIDSAAQSQVPRTAGVAGAYQAGIVGAVLGSVIEASAQDTQRKAVEFPLLIKKRFPGLDLRADLLSAFRIALEAKGINVRVSSETRNLTPRLHWPAKNEKGESIAAGPLANGPAVDADLLIQLSPVAFYLAPGPLNSYQRSAGIGLAMFNGRTRQFIGWEAFPFKFEIDDRGYMKDDFTYARYGALVDDLDRAVPALRSALLSLVPAVVKTVSGE